MARLMTIVVLVFLFCPGCSHLVADYILHFGSNRGTPLTDEHPDTIPFAQGHTLRVQDDPPVDLAVWVIEPQHFQVEMWSGEKEAPTIPEGWVSAGKAWMNVPYVAGHKFFSGLPATSFHFHLQWFTKESTPEMTPRGTILLLPGQGGCSRVHWSQWFIPASFANAGYRVVMVDLRSQGDSTGKELGFIIKDAQDVSKVLDWLEQSNLLTKPVGVMGHSYGAATGGLATVNDPRIATAVLSGMPIGWRSTIEFQLTRDSNSYETLHRLGIWIWKLMPDFSRERMFQLCSERMGYDAFNFDTRKWTLQTKKPVLLLHGREDERVPIEHALAIYQTRPKNTRLVIFENSGHGDYFLTHFDEVRALCLEWFAEHMKE